MNRLPLLLATAGLLSACGSALEPREVTAEDPEVARIAAQNNAFTLDVMNAISSEEPNTFISAFSMNAALSMVYAGAEGVTASEMETVLHLDPSADHHGPTGRLLRDLSGDKNRPYTLRAANRLWVREGERLEQSFLDITEQDYGAPTVMADMAGNADGVREEVNTWVAEETEDRITDLLPPGSVSSSTVLILANAIYFKADWARAFDRNSTLLGDFTKLDGSTVQVDMMNGTFDMSYAEAEDYRVVGLDYGEEADVRLWVLLPNDGVELADVAQGLDATALSQTFDQAQEQEVVLALPKLEVRSRVQLSSVLSDLGMPSAFSSGNADFSGIRASGGLYVDEVYHQAFVKMDEEGTEAAAATGVVMNESADVEPTVFRVNRPYMFIVRDELTGAFLFSGRIGDPSASSDGGPQ